MQNFWKKLPHPFFVLAPMEDITDAAFRALVAEQTKKPDVFYTEFTSADGLALAPESGKTALLKKLSFGPRERPIVAQFFTAVPEYMERAAALAVEFGFDGVDINMGCPEDKIEKGNCGAALIKNPLLVRELIRAAKRGAPHVPLSVKTRIGYERDELAVWLPELLSENLAAITLHARTRKEMSRVPAQWDAIRRAVDMRDTLSPSTLIIGNGDVKTLEDGRVRVRETRCDGVMIGRAAIANPWLWAEYEPTRTERLHTLRRHAELAEKYFGYLTGNVKKHLTKFPTGFHGAKEIRAAIADAHSFQDIVVLVEQFK